MKDSDIKTLGSDFYASMTPDETLEFDHPTEFHLRQISRMFNEAVEQFKVESPHPEDINHGPDVRVAVAMEHLSRFLNDCESEKRLYWFMKALEASNNILSLSRYTNFLRNDPK